MKRLFVFKLDIWHIKIREFCVGVFSILLDDVTIDRFILIIENLDEKNIKCLDAFGKIFNEYLQSVNIIVKNNPHTCNIHSVPGQSLILWGPFINQGYQRLRLSLLLHPQ